MNTLISSLLLVSSIFYFAAKIRDIYSSSGLKEKFWLARGLDGYFSPVRAWIITIGYYLLVLGVSLLIAKFIIAKWHAFWVVIVGCVVQGIYSWKAASVNNTLRSRL